MGVVIKGFYDVLVHMPDFVRFGSKCIRDIEDNNDILEEIQKRLRSFNDVLSYAPNQVFIGNLAPDELLKINQPWYNNPIENDSRFGSFGEILPEIEFYGMLKAADEFNIIYLSKEFTEQIKDQGKNQLFIEKLDSGFSMEKILSVIESASALPLYYENRLIGSARRDHMRDDTLKAHVLLENLIAKASGTFAMSNLLKRAQKDAAEIDFVLDCTETAIGDRYNRGGGSLSKSMAEMCGCINASGHDIRAFCCSPIHAIINASGLIESGIFKKVVVAGGGCLSKMGMKYAAHVKNNMPILEDVIGSIAFLLEKDDEKSPKIRLECIGTHDVGAGSSQEAIFRSLIVKPLEKIGLKIIDIDKFSTELHNPEVTLPAGSGNTPLTNYKMIGALAAIRKEIDISEIDNFVKQYGMPGYCPTQGHIPSAVPFIGHAIEAMQKGEMNKVMFVAKGSLFLGRMSQLSDGVSFLLEANNQNGSR
jgi:betaine reductase